MTKVAKIAVSIAVKVKQGDLKSCCRELETAIQKEMGTYFLGIKVVEGAGIFKELEVFSGAVNTCHLVFKGQEAGASFERESIVGILEKMNPASFDIAAISHTPFYYTEYSK